MSSMLEDLLSLGRLEEGLVESRPQTFDLEKFMPEFISDMSEMAKAGQTITYVANGGGLVNTDKRLFRNVLTNLVSNAVKFSPENSEIIISSFNENGELLVSIKDNGMGISEEDQQHLFERFFRARNALNVQGTGLGLHIVSKYLELLNGSISLESKLNEGSTFTISLHSI
jgi:signal transduction histidine kinase